MNRRQRLIKHIGLVRVWAAYRDLFYILIVLGVLSFGYWALLLNVDFNLSPPIEPVKLKKLSLAISFLIVAI